MSATTSPLFTREGPGYYAAAFQHNAPFAATIGGSFFTILTPEEEADFRAWLKRNRVPFDPDALISDYDMRGYWKAGPSWAGGQAHFPDTWKTPYDTTFSAESRYATAECPFKWHGERLIDERDGSVVFEELKIVVGAGIAVGPRTAGGIDYLARKGADGDGTPDGTEKKHHGSGKIPLRRVRGIQSNLDDLVLRGQKLRAVIGDALLDGTLTRTAQGASTLKLDVLDSPRTLLQHPLLEEKHVVSLDGLPFRFVAAQDEGRLAPLQLTYEPLLVALLREIKGPHKAFRDVMTRAEFAKRLALMAKALGIPVRFICPELHVIQPIKSSKAAKEAAEEADDVRGKGLTHHNTVDLKVKNVEATAAQVSLGDNALRIGEELKSPERVLVALIAALIDESLMGAESHNVLQAEPFIAQGASTPPEAEIRGFLTGKHWTETGALDYFKANPNASPAQIASAVQGNKAGPAPYAAVEEEARAWVEADGGASSATVRTVERFGWKQDKKTGNWEEIVDLADDVDWRAFESGNWIYFIAEPDLLKSRLRMSVTDSTPGIIDTRLRYDEGKKTQEITVEARAKAWEAPPGTAAVVRNHGPGNGVYVVEKIEAPLAHRDAVCQITLARPTVPLKEPAPETSTKTLGGRGSAGTGSVEQMIAEIDRIDAKHYPYSSPGARGTPPPATGPYDCSGFVSRVLYVGGFLKTTTASAELASMFQAGEGDELTIYAKGPDGPSGHVLGKILTPGGWRFFATSSDNPGGGAGWVGAAGEQPYDAAYLSDFQARHPAGV